MFRICSFQGTVFSLLSKTSGDKEIRTLDPLLARQVLSQLSYIPICSYSDLSGLFLFSMKVFKPMSLSGPFLFSAKAFKPMGLSGLEPPTSRLSGVRSNQLSYKPIRKLRYLPSTKFSYASLRFGKRLALNSIFA